MNRLKPTDMCGYCQHFDLVGCMSSVTVSHITPYCTIEAQPCGGKCRAFETRTIVNQCIKALIHAIAESTVKYMKGDSNDEA